MSGNRLLPTFFLFFKKNDIISNFDLISCLLLLRSIYLVICSVMCCFKMFWGLLSHILFLCSMNPSLVNLYILLTCFRSLTSTLKAIYSLLFHDLSQKYCTWSCIRPITSHFRFIHSIIPYSIFSIILGTKRYILSWKPSFFSLFDENNITPPMIIFYYCVLWISPS